MFSLSSLLESRNCVLHLRKILDLQRIQKKVQQTKMDALSIPGLRDQKGAKNRRTKWPRMRGRDAVRKSTPKVNILQVFTIDFSEIQSDGQNKKEWDELAKEDHTYKLTPEDRRRYKGQWFLTLNKEGKNGPMKLRSHYRVAVFLK